MDRFDQIIVKGCLHVRQNIAYDKNCWARLPTVQLSIKSSLAAPSRWRDGAAKPELIDSCSVRSPALSYAMFCHTCKHPLSGYLKPDCAVKKIIRITSDLAADGMVMNDELFVAVGLLSLLPSRLPQP